MDYAAIKIARQRSDIRIDQARAQQQTPRRKRNRRSRQERNSKHIAQRENFREAGDRRAA